VLFAVALTLMLATDKLLGRWFKEKPAQPAAPAPGSPA
jgi:hypothetical protein